MIYEDIKFKDYPIIVHSYGGETHPGVLSLPEDMKLVAGDRHDIGQVLYKDCLHYMGCYDKYILDDDRFHRTGAEYEIGDLVFVSFENLHFVDEKPEIITGEEFQKEFLGPNFLIFTWSEQKELVSATKILKFVTPYQVECASLTLPVESLREDDTFFIRKKRCEFISFTHDGPADKLTSTFTFNNPKANAAWNQLLEKYVGFSRIGDTTPIEFDEDEPSKLFKEGEDILVDILNGDYQSEEEEAKNKLWSIISKTNKIMEFED